MRQISVWRRVIVGILLAVSFSYAHAADVNAHIKGTVTDPGGAVIVKASVIATNENTGVKYTTESQADGGYLFPQLPIGTYTIKISAPGFKEFQATGIVLNIAQEYVEPAVLTVGSTSDMVEIHADAVQVNTTDMQLSNIVNSSQMVELPLIGRNFANLELTLPGVQLPDTRFANTFSVSGAQAQQSEYLINGADTNDFALNTLAFVPNLDAIDQFNLIDGPLNAEYDRNSGGIVSTTIKQGSNHIHGDVFEFYRDTFLNTNNFFQKSATGAPKPVSPFHQNIFGGTIGGPILKDKLFIFGAYQGTRQSVPQTTPGTNVFTSAQLSGDFSTDYTLNSGSNAAGATGFNPATIVPSSLNIPGCPAGSTWGSCFGYATVDAKGNPTGLVPGTVSNGKIPVSAFNPVALALVKKYVPAPNSGAFGYIYNATTATTTDQYLGRVDFSPNSKNQFTVVGIFQSSSSLNTLPFSGATLPGFGDGSISHPQQYTGEYTRQISSTTVNNLAAHYTRFNFKSGAPQQVVQPSSVGFSITPQDTSSATVPQLGAAGYFTIGGTNNGPQPRIDQTIQLDDNLSKVIGHHSLKFGYDGRKFSVWNLFDNSNSGNFSFNTSGTYSTGDPGLDLLLGVPATYSQGTGNIIQADAFLNYIYAQDSWKVTSTFTLSYGLGYSIDTPLRNHQYKGEAVSCFIVGAQSKIFPNAPKNLVYPGDPGCTFSGQAYTRYSEFGPRLGFAWAPDLGVISGSPGKFSIRAGFGIYYDRTEEESALQTLATPPFGFTSGGATDGGGDPSLVNPFADINGGKPLANRFPYIPPTAGQNVDFSGLEPIFNISSFAPTFRAPYSENFQLSLERELPSRLVARVSYVGALARHNQTTPEANYETAAGHAACLANSACSGAGRNSQALLFPGNTIGGSSNIVEEGLADSGASSSYHSAQISLTKAPTHGLQFQMSYTYAHALDNGSSFENSGFGGSGARGFNQFQPSLNYGDSTFDARHHFVFAPVYEVPTFKSGSTFSPMNLLLSGWQVSGILQLATGLPFDISYAGTTSRSLWCSANLSFYACPDVPLQTAPLVKSNPRVRIASGNSVYFSGTSFAAEPIGSFGNVHRNPYHGPGSNNTNLILAKNFSLSSDGVRRLQLRMESDNVFNHTQFNNPVSTFGSGTFGQITSAAAARQTQLGAKIYF
jgi:hypothetical protein